MTEPARSAVGEVLISEEQLQKRVAELAADVSADYAGQDLLVIGVLKGAVFFIADLLRQLTVACELDFMAVSSYGSSTHSSGVVRIQKDLDVPIAGRHVLLVEDVIDSGLTLSYLLKNLASRAARLAGDLHAARQARPQAPGHRQPLRRVRAARRLRDRLRARLRPALPQPPVHRRSRAVSPG